MRAAIWTAWHFSSGASGDSGIARATGLDMPRVVKTRRSKFFQSPSVSFGSQKTFTLYLNTGLRLGRAIVSEEDSGCVFAAIRTERTDDRGRRCSEGRWQI